MDFFELENGEVEALTMVKQKAKAKTKVQRTPKPERISLLTDSNQFSEWLLQSLSLPLRTEILWNSGNILTHAHTSIAAF